MLTANAREEAIITSQLVEGNGDKDGAAVAEFTDSERSKVLSPILDPQKSADAIAWNFEWHPKKSGVAPEEIRKALTRYVDFGEIQKALDRYNMAHGTAKIDPGSPPINAVLIEAIHQFQIKCFVDATQKNGRAGESTLDSLGLVDRTGLQDADKPNATAQERLDRLDSKIAKNWFRNLLNPTFLGQRFESAGDLTGIHLVLARKLRIVEKHLLGMPAYSGKTPVELGKVLGIVERHKGMRYTKSKGMHTFGLALDINYRGNPYISGDKNRPNGNKNFIEIMKCATLLISGKEIKFTPAYLNSLAAEPDPSTGRIRSTGEIYDALAKRDKEFREYLQFATDINALKKKLQERVDQGTANVFQSDQEKKDLTAAAKRWQDKIQKHLKSLKPYFGSRNPLHGFLNLNRDLVIALREQACLAWGAVDFGGASGDIMHFDCRVEGVGKIINPGNKPPKTHPCSSAKAETKQVPVKPKVAKPAEIPSGTCTLKDKNQPPAYTLYCQIDLGIGTSENAGGKKFKVEPGTGIFIPENYDPQQSVNLALYLHGHKGDFPGDDQSIEQYWSKHDFFRFREELNRSGTNFILVAPTLGPLSQAGSLTKAGGFDSYLTKVIMALKQQGPHKDQNLLPRIGNIVLACHSGSGKNMLAIVSNRDSNTAKIKECWGFDCLYAGKRSDSPEEREKKQTHLAMQWRDWANSHEDAHLYIYYLSSTSGTSEKLKALTFKHNNVHVEYSDAAKDKQKKEKSKASAHFWVPIVHWIDRLKGVSFGLVKVSGTKQTAPAAVVTFPSGESLTTVSGPEKAEEEYYDANKSGNPLLDTSGSNRPKKLSRDFSVQEIAKSGSKKFEKARIDPELVTCLQAIRDSVGKSVIINSGYRSYGYNLDLYKRLGQEPKKKSQHTSGRAADIKISGMNGVDVAKAAIDACGCKIAIGLGANFAHVDVRGEFVVWNYGGATQEQVEEIRTYQKEKCSKAAEEIGALP